MRIRLAFTTLLLLSGCASLSKDCDPSSGGLFGAIGCDASGRYDERLQTKQSQEAALMKRKAELVQQQQALEAEQATIAAALREKEAARAKAARELQALRARLKREQGHKQSLKAEAKALEDELAREQTEVSALNEAQARKQARIAELERESAALTKEYEAAQKR